MRLFKKLLLSVGLVLVSASLLVAAEAKEQEKEEYHEGFEYIKIVPPQPTQAKAGQVEVVEVFWYGCPHCYRFEPFLNKWLKNKPKNVVFFRIPGVINPGWEVHARAFYVAQLLQVGDKIHTPLFDALHKERKALNTKQALAGFFSKYGVDKKKFLAAYDSFQVEMRIKRAKAVVQKYGVYGVPTLIVNGKYRIGATNADQSFAKMIRIMQYLIKKEQAGS